MGLKIHGRRRSMPGRLVLLILLIGLFPLLIGGCGKKEEPQQQGMTLDQLVTETAEGRVVSDLAQQLDGQEITLQGWMSPLSPLYANYFFLIGSPSEDCPFCAGAEVDFYDVVIVYVEENHIVPFIFDPVLVTGTLQVGYEQDGHMESYFRVQSRLTEVRNFTAK